MPANSVAPLNIAHRSQSQSTSSSILNTKLISSAPASASAPSLLSPSSVPPMSSSKFKGNMQKNSPDTHCKLHVIDTHICDRDSQKRGNRRFFTERYSSLKSSYPLMSPTTFTLAKNDISKVNNSVISRLNSEILLTLFPPPPHAFPKSKAQTTPCSKTRSAPVSTGLPTIESEEPAASSSVSPPPSKSGKNRNWVISSGFFVTLTEDGQKSHISVIPGIARLREQGSEPNTPDTPMLNIKPVHNQSLPPCQPLSSSIPPPSLNPSTTYCSSDQASCAPPQSSRLSDYCSDVKAPYAPVPFLDEMNSLSERLLEIETQMRRPSFLMNRRTSVLSALFPSNIIAPVSVSTPVSASVPVMGDMISKHQQEILLAELSLTVGSITTPSPEVPAFLNGLHSNSKSVNNRAAAVEAAFDSVRVSDEATESTLVSAPLMDWARRRKQLPCPTDPPLSSLFSTNMPNGKPYSSSSTKASAMSSTTKSMGHKPRKFFSALTNPGIGAGSAPSVSSFPTQMSRPSPSGYPRSSTIPLLPIKDDHGEDSNAYCSALRKNKGHQKWGERLQSLVHTFQFTNNGNKSNRLSKKLAGILPKNRWDKRSRGSPRTHYRSSFELKRS
ncbi:hypothetical protein BX616_001010 [Lobosporangium transversale]|uniref:Uncharacterized protein n=1 Tax=Lobosporangium transversale TaxID=64571 RepID=A0A1Y2GT82_9FUNG|nr:hypothetical protein BCR41DRAFT_394303 [Lobosporangium transversale]KAF9905448.1 hypothetical protein BX616_001010 [Lobosporangium transversale]ORZ22727.1 hypothetical protein BCR41DRAFT_394303 [Lobosporangium transversale]|eukprot:XP_021883281.1 hypothetical protein BCR41DRAFT_394303 [Lobosporangium transversale]